MIERRDLDFRGRDMQRPECVLAHVSGYLFASDVGGNGGVAIVAPDDTVRRLSARSVAEPLRPNGIALLPDAAFLLAHLGAERGGVFRLDVDGSVSLYLGEVGGTSLPPTNFVMHDAKGRTWVTVSTRKRPRRLDYRPDASDGFVVLMDGRGARVVADGLGYTNECAIHPDGERLFVNETFARRISAFTIRSDGSLVDRRVVARFGAGVFPDGMAFDAAGGLWITSIVSNRVIRIAPEEGQEVFLDDGDPLHVAEVELAFRTSAMGSEHLEGGQDGRLGNVSSLAFGGADLRTIHLGTLMNPRIPSFRAPLPGHRPPHWDYDLSALIPATSP
jgi:sugar lactone lactonase YvrE